jgi:hypothetical protein
MRDDERTYKIVRHFQNESLENKTIYEGMTLEEAKAHCNDPESSSRSCTSAEGRARTKKFGNWFDGYTEE